MKRSEINQAVRNAQNHFQQNGWTLPPESKWDVTDFGSENFKKYGLLLINLAEEPEYCEKLMYAAKGQITPAHCHKKKKEDIVCRKGMLVIQVWASDPVKNNDGGRVEVQVNGKRKILGFGDEIKLHSGERMTIFPLVWHKFYPVSDQCIMGEVSTSNDDVNDNFFANKDIGRFSEIEEDEPAIVKLVSDK